MKAKLFVLAAILLSGCLVFGQGNYKGSITAEVTTEDGSPLPGAVAELTADTFSRSFVSDANGMVRFVGLTPGRFELRVTFTGFNTYVRPNIVVDTSQNVRLTVAMTPNTQQEEMVVTLESPLLDSTKVGTATVMTEEELNAVPQSRDPWSVIMTVPGVQTDRINVGGSEAGQQSNFASKGDDGSNASWVMDGIEFVDPAARGATQSYLDFSSFQQMNVTTGGADVTQRSGGAALSFVTKQGSNNHQGSVRLLYADEDFQSDYKYFETGANGQEKEFFRNRIAETFEKSFEIGGPIIKDRLWYWGAFSQNSITAITITNQEDRTELRNISLKIHGDITATTRFNAFYTEGDKIKSGRGAGFGRPTNTTWDQSGPSPIYKFELNQLVGQNTELSFLMARVDGGFALAPKGTSGQIGLDTGTGVWEDTTFIGYSTRRPVRQYEIKGNTFLTSSSIDHEISYGFQYKEASVNSRTTYGSDGLIRYLNNGTPYAVGLYRETNVNTDAEYVSVTAQDTMTYGNWTFKAGLRWDRQEANNTPAFVAANAFNPELLPAVDYPGGDTLYSWSNIAPRLGVTYTTGSDNQYLFRGSVSKFYDTMGTGTTAVTAPSFVQYSYHYWNDANGNLNVDQGEVDPVSLANTLGTPLAAIDPDLESPETSELILGAEWAITPEFTLGLTGTIRERKNAIWNSNNVKSGMSLDNSDFEKVTHSSGYEYFRLLGEDSTDGATRGVEKLIDLGTLTANRPGYSEDYKGLEFTATKRLSNRWMLRGNVTIQDWTRNVGADAIQNPSNFQSGINEDGGSVGVQSAGSGNRANVWYGSSTWTFNVNGLYQLPWDVTVSANINGREGFTQPLARRFVTFDELNGVSRRNVNFIKNAGFDDQRGDDIIVADLKLTKTFHLSGRTKVEIAAEIFNVTDENVVMARQLRQDVGTANEPVEILAPRVGRFSATVHF